MQRILDSNDRRIDLLVGPLKDAGIRDNKTLTLVSYFDGVFFKCKISEIQLFYSYQVWIFLILFLKTRFIIELEVISWTKKKLNILKGKYQGNEVQSLLDTIVQLDKTKLFLLYSTFGSLRAFYQSYVAEFLGRF